MLEAAIPVLERLDIWTVDAIDTLLAAGTTGSEKRYFIVACKNCSCRYDSNPRRSPSKY